MLVQLEVKNVALIKQLNIDISNGMTVLTGETGAGKSIIIDSINLILGDRTRKELVRSGEEKLKVQAVFDIDSTLSAQLTGDGIEVEENQLVISRQVSADGKSVCRINGTIVTLTYLRDIAASLVNIHGQHDNQALLNPKKHINFLDSYGSYADELLAYKKEYLEYTALLKRIEKLSQSESERIKRLDLLNYQTDELARADIKRGEEAELREQRDVIANAEAIAEASYKAYQSLYARDVSAYDLISTAISSLGEISEYPRVSELIETLNNSAYAIEEASHDINSLSDGVEYDERVLSEIEDRLAVISNMKRKYGATEDEVIEYFESIKQEKEELLCSDELLNELQAELSSSEARLGAAADVLSKVRYDAAVSLEREIRESLAQLDMGSCDFRVNISKNDAYGACGLDTVEFFISTNPGEAARPLEKVASGGELSRVMLAMKSVLADTDNVDTLIFDEIDTGVSGAAAKKIAEKLYAIGKKKQVICITHQAIIAAAAHTHLFIKKAVLDERTETSVRELNRNERVEELARITDGDITEASLAHAREMLNKR